MLFMCCCVQTKTTPLETEAEEEDEVLRCVRELKSEMVDLRQDRALTANQSTGDLQSQLTKFDEEQQATKHKLEAQTSAITQLQHQMHRIEQLCIKLNDDIKTLTTKAQLPITQTRGACATVLIPYTAIPLAFQQILNSSSLYDFNTTAC